MWTAARGALEKARRSAEVISTVLLMSLVIFSMAADEGGLDAEPSSRAPSTPSPVPVDPRLTAALWFASGESPPVDLRALGAIAIVPLLLGHPPAGAQFARLCVRAGGASSPGLGGLIETIQTSRAATTDACAARIATELHLGRSLGTIAEHLRDDGFAELDALDWPRVVTLAAAIGEPGALCRPERLRALRERLVTRLLAAGEVSAAQAGRLDSAPLPRSVCFPPRP